MAKENKITYRIRAAFVILAAVLMIMLFAVMPASTGFVYAAAEAGTEEPIRAVHNVGVGNETYCFFVTHNVVLTRSEVDELSDEELTAAILERAGLYMKEANCKAAGHKAITIKDWNKKGGFLLSEPDIEGIRTAEPVDGSPVKFYMDLIIYRNDEAKAETETEEGEQAGEQPLYSTFKRTSPRLLFAVVATEEDAKYGEDICKEDKQDDQGKQPDKSKTPRPGKTGRPEVSDEEMLPEYRTINMVDRSGKPLEDTLKDGEPVHLEWIEPKNNSGTEEGSSFIDRIPGGAAGLAVIGAAAAFVVVFAVRRKKTEE